MISNTSGYDKIYAATYGEWKTSPFDEKIVSTTINTMATFLRKQGNVQDFSDECVLPEAPFF
jgi:hypothetical protein